MPARSFHPPASPSPSCLWAGPALAWFGIWLGSLVLNLGVLGLNGDLSPAYSHLVAGDVPAAPRYRHGWRISRSAAMRRAPGRRWKSNPTSCGAWCWSARRASLVSATAGVSMLHAQGVIGVQEYAASPGGAGGRAIPWAYWSRCRSASPCFCAKTHPWRGRLAAAADPDERGGPAGRRRLFRRHALGTLPAAANDPEPWGEHRAIARSAHHRPPRVPRRAATPD